MTKTQPFRIILLLSMHLRLFTVWSYLYGRNAIQWCTSLPHSVTSCWWPKIGHVTPRDLPTLHKSALRERLLNVYQHTSGRAPSYYEGPQAVWARGGLRSGLVPRVCGRGDQTGTREEGGAGCRPHCGSVRLRTPSNVCKVETLEKKGKNYSKIFFYYCLDYFGHLSVWQALPELPWRVPESINGKGCSAGTDVGAGPGPHSGDSTPGWWQAGMKGCVCSPAPSSCSLGRGSQRLGVRAPLWGLHGALVHPEAVLAHLYP